MGMFLNYQNIAENYQPNNLVAAFPTYTYETKLNPIDISKPYEEYDIKGNLIGYSWVYGETIILEFLIDGKITIESTDIVYNYTGGAPDTHTVGNIGTCAYNVVDFISWTCVGIENDSYIWAQDTSFKYNESGSRDVYISSKDYLKNKIASFKLYNFRHEVIYELSLPATEVFKVEIDKELSNKLVKGLYYCSLTVIGDSSTQVVFDESDGSLLVK